MSKVNFNANICIAKNTKHLDSSSMFNSKDTVKFDVYEKSSDLLVGLSKPVDQNLVKSLQDFFKIKQS